MNLSYIVYHIANSTYRMDAATADVVHRAILKSMVELFGSPENVAADVLYQPQKWGYGPVDSANGRFLAEVEAKRKEEYVEKVSAQIREFLEGPADFIGPKGIGRKLQELE